MWIPCCSCLFLFRCMDYINKLLGPDFLVPTPHSRTRRVTKEPTANNMKAEEALWGLRQGGRKLERYVEEFLELANQLSWHDAALGAQSIAIFPFVKEDYMSRRPAPSGARRVVSAHTTPGAPTSRTKGSDRLPRPKRTPLVQGSICFLSPAAARSKPPEPAARSWTPAVAPRSSQPAAAPQAPASHICHKNAMDPYGLLSPSSPLVPSSPPEPERRPEPAPPECPLVPAPPKPGPPVLSRADNTLIFPQENLVFPVPLSIMTSLFNHSHLSSSD
ncbi:hypothetical protein M9458_054583 [Cirrhinus mrigala]|uniref:Retrotransposon gag domain-containing protein n=1 Tax=Cirrhinus mrigala TaxID=683832 RepID=A0ABD0MNF2_CIRMR